MNEDKLCCIKSLYSFSNFTRSAAAVKVCRYLRIDFLWNNLQLNSCWVLLCSLQASKGLISRFQMFEFIVFSSHWGVPTMGANQDLKELRKCVWLRFYMKINKYMTAAAITVSIGYILMLCGTLTHTHTFWKLGNYVLGASSNNDVVQKQVKHIDEVDALTSLVYQKEIF